MMTVRLAPSPSPHQWFPPLFLWGVVWLWVASPVPVVWFGSGLGLLRIFCPFPPLWRCGFGFLEAGRARGWNALRGGR